MGDSFYPNAAFSSEEEHLRWRISRRSRILSEHQGELTEDDEDQYRQMNREDRARLDELRNGGA